MEDKKIIDSIKNEFKYLNRNDKINIRNIIINYQINDIIYPTKPGKVQVLLLKIKNRFI
jgi:hypothetical protein